MTDSDPAPQSLHDGEQAMERTLRSDADPLDVGGVLLLPGPEVVTRALQQTGVEPDDAALEHVRCQAIAATDLALDTAPCNTDEPATTRVAHTINLQPFPEEFRPTTPSGAATIRRPHPT